VSAATGTGTVDSLKHGLGFVEVAPELCREALERLLYHAYRLGGAAPILVWRNGVSMNMLEAALAPAVASLGTDRAGVEYLEVTSTAGAAAYARDARFCVLASDRLRPFLNSASRVLGAEDISSICPAPR
jgi:hypothetical protein